MSMYGVDMPMGRTAHDKKMRRDVFDVIHPYVMSAADMAEVALAGQQVLDLWLETFTNSQKVMIGTTLNWEAKYISTVFFKSRPWRYSIRQVWRPCGTWAWTVDPASVSCDVCALI